jgi:hypothetical protein
MSESSDSESPVKAPPPRPKQQQQQQPSPAKADAQQPALKPSKQQQQQPAPTKSASETVEAAAAAGAKLSKEARDALVQKLIQANAHPPPASLPRSQMCRTSAGARQLLRPPRRRPLHKVARRRAEAACESASSRLIRWVAIMIQKKRGKDPVSSSSSSSGSSRHPPGRRLPPRAPAQRQPRAALLRLRLLRPQPSPSSPRSTRTLRR